MKNFLNLATSKLPALFSLQWHILGRHSRIWISSEKFKRNTNVIHEIENTKVFHSYLLEPTFFLFLLSLFSRSYASSPVALQQKDCKIGWSRKMSISKWDWVYTFLPLFSAPLRRLRRFHSNIGWCSNVKQIDFISEPIYLEREKNEGKKCIKFPKCISNKR